uniref:Uncharacterized protein n=1 Tax=Anguilla anguilla TaxID=7936 RepID=A0A0E9Q1T0_ANGAN
MVGIIVLLKDAFVAKFELPGKENQDFGQNS